MCAVVVVVVVVVVFAYSYGYSVMTGEVLKIGWPNKNVMSVQCIDGWVW
jgi:hypothetical protein